MLVTVLKYTPSTRLGKMKEKNVLVLVCVDPCDKFAVRLCTRAASWVMWTAPYLWEHLGEADDTVL